MDLVPAKIPRAHFQMLVLVGWLVSFVLSKGLLCSPGCLAHAAYLNLSQNSESFCLKPPSAGIKGTQHHTWLKCFPDSGIYFIHTAWNSFYLFKEKVSEKFFLTWFCSLKKVDLGD